MPSDKDIFVDAIELNRADRAEFLSTACNGDPGLRERIEMLLQGHDQSDGFLNVPLLGYSTDLFIGMPSDRIGRYKLLEKIGEGGCGVVYLAEQQEPVRRKVALKVIKLGMDTRAVIARFEAERQALAMMDHPNISKVFDADATENGRPYFVMEWVRGIPITRYCDEAHLSPEKRIELMLGVCLAIEHAHQQGIVHRDLKPSNILVTVNDGLPVAKVIDFGVAKATQGRLTDQTFFTAVEHFIGTPAYMSPEQAETGGLDVDSRSDIYSLGVLLYELLTGVQPFDPKAFSGAGVDEIRKKIRESEPPKPSARLRGLSDDGREAVASWRGTAFTDLSLLLRGDLDWIVMRCLEKDRTRRYSSARALGLDLERHLRHEPIFARPPSATYVAGKFIHRHRKGLTAIVAVVVAVAFGALADVLWHSRGVQGPAPEPTQSAEANQFLAKARIACTKLDFKREDLDAAEDLSRRATELDPASAAAWGLRARVQITFVVRGWTENFQVRTQEAERSANRSLALDPNNPDALFSLAWVVIIQSRTSESGQIPALERQAEALLRRALQTEPDESFFVRSLATSLNFQGRGEDARDVLRAAIKRNPSDPMLHYDLGSNNASMFGAGGASPVQLAAAIREFDLSYSVGHFAGPMLQKAMLVAGWSGDLIQMRSALDQVDRQPLADRAADRAVWVSMLAGLLERRPDRTFLAAGMTAKDYLGPDTLIHEPKAMMRAEARQLEGEGNMARQEWQAAETILRHRLATNSGALSARDQVAAGNICDHIQLAIALAQLDRRPEAEELIGRVEPTVRELKQGNNNLWWLARYYAACGDLRAIWFLDRSVNASSLSAVNIVRLDPAFDKLRGKPDFDAFIARALGQLK